MWLSHSLVPLLQVPAIRLAAMFPRGYMASMEIFYANFISETQNA
ncbi:MAG: hypothetical protein QOJ41_448 [Acidobacteriaceae bacterium]|jgi:hypothetical protein|nr:hypothetical protein [Acidobacteriaceae bacterium]